MPNAIPDVSVTVAPDKPASITLPAVQAGGVLTGFSQPASGQVSLNPDQSLTYVPPADTARVASPCRAVGVTLTTRGQPLRPSRGDPEGRCTFT